MFFFCMTPFLTNGQFAGHSTFDVQVAVLLFKCQLSLLPRSKCLYLQLQPFDLWFRALGWSQQTTGFGRDLWFLTYLIDSGILRASAFEVLFHHVGIFTEMHPHLKQNMMCNSWVMHSVTSESLCIIRGRHYWIDSSMGLSIFLKQVRGLVLAEVLLKVVNYMLLLQRNMCLKHLRDGATTQFFKPGLCRNCTVGR